MIKHFEHIGMTTSNMDACLNFYVDLLGAKLVSRRVTPKGDGELAFVDVGGGLLEITTRNRGMKTPAYVVPMTEVGLRHITFEVEDLDADYARLMQAGVPSAETPRDAYNFDVYNRVCFVKDPDGILIELVSRQPSFTAGR